MQLTALAETIGLALDENFDRSERQVRQFLTLVEEAGEFADAFVTYDTAYNFTMYSPDRAHVDVPALWQEVVTEFADVVITLYVCAWVLDIALPETIEDTRVRGEDGYGQVLSLTRAVGRLTGSFRRFAGMARRTGTRDEVEIALFAVFHVVAQTARVFDIDVHTAVAQKSDKILTRGWKDTR